MYLGSQNLEQTNVKSWALTRLNYMEVNFFPKGDSKYPFIYKLKKPACAPNRDGILLTT